MSRGLNLSRLFQKHSGLWLPSSALTFADWFPFGSCCTAPCGCLSTYTDATALTVTHGTVHAGTFASLYDHPADGLLSIGPDANGIDVYVTYQLGTPNNPGWSRHVGNYNAAIGKSIDIYHYDFSDTSWTLIDTWNHQTSQFPQPNCNLESAHVSGSGEVRVRWHTDDTNAAYRLHLGASRVCSDGEDPQQMQAVINCPVCTELNGTFVLDLEKACYTTGFTWQTWWRYDFPSAFTCTGGGGWFINMLRIRDIYASWQGPATHTLYLYATHSVGGGGATWGKILDGTRPPADYAFVNEPLPNINFFGPPPGPCVNDALITAL